MMPETVREIKINSSHAAGDEDGAAFVVDERGRILRTSLLDSWDNPIPERFDVDEYKDTYGELHEHIDILDIGYFNPDGKYIPPDFKWRKQIAKELGLNKPKQNFAAIRRILDNPNGCLQVEELLNAIGDECVRNGSKPFNEMGGHFVWLAIARDIRKLAAEIGTHHYMRHCIHANPNKDSNIVGLKPE